jgi:DNA polymerase-4
VFARITPYVEPLALDEAFLDVSGARALFGDGVTIAHRIRNEVRAELQLDCSVGVAPNKFLAKLASVEAKPRAGTEGVRPGLGVFEVRPGHELAYLHALPVRRLWGVGPKPLERLQAVGIATVGDLAASDPDAVIARLGRAQGEHLLALAAGRDDRAVEPERVVKSVSHEETFAEDLYDRDEIRRELVRLADAVASRLRGGGLAARTVTVKVRDGTFATLTRSITLPSPVDTAHALLTAAQPLVDALDLDRGVRLLGLGAAKFAPRAEQLRLDVDEHPTQPWEAASDAVDDVRRRFGERSIGPASAVRDGELRLVRTGEQQWGPGDKARRQTPENLG